MFSPSVSHMLPKGVKETRLFDLCFKDYVVSGSIGQECVAIMSTQYYKLLRFFLIIVYQLNYM